MLARVVMRLITAMAVRSCDDRYDLDAYQYITLSQSGVIR